MVRGYILYIIPLENCPQIHYRHRGGVMLIFPVLESHRNSRQLDLKFVKMWTSMDHSVSRLTRHGIQYIPFCR